MKKNKFLLVSVLFIAIFLVQPQNFQSFKSAFTQNDIATQLNISDSPEEKMRTWTMLIRHKMKN